MKTTEHTEETQKCNIVFIQSFPLAEELRIDLNNISSVIITSKEEDEDENKRVKIWDIGIKNSNSLIYDRFEVEGFDYSFRIPTSSNNSSNDLIIEGHCSIEMTVFFKRTISLVYTFTIDPNKLSYKGTENIDSIISLISSYIVPEPQSDPLDIYDYSTIHPTGEVTAKVSFPIDEDGLGNGDRDSYKKVVLSETCYKGQKGVELALRDMRHRYQSYINLFCTRLKKGVSTSYNRPVMNLAFNSTKEIDYVFIDTSKAFCSMKLGTMNKTDDSNKNTDASFKKMLMGIVSVQPFTWQSISEESFDRLCGPDISINEKDRIYIGDRVAICLDSFCACAQEGHNRANETTDSNRQRDFLLILQYYIAQKTFIQEATRLLIRNAAFKSDNTPIDRTISHNQKISFLLAQSMLQYDAVQYNSLYLEKLANGIASRLSIDIEQDRFNRHIKTVNDSLKSIHDSQTSSREITMNIILGIVSVISAFQLFFVGTTMPFLSEYWHVESGKIGAILISLVAAVAIITIIIFLFSAIRSLFNTIRNK